MHLNVWLSEALRRTRHLRRVRARSSTVLRQVICFLAGVVICSVCQVLCKVCEQFVGFKNRCHATSTPHGMPTEEEFLQFVFELPTDRGEMTHPWSRFPPSAVVRQVHRARRRPGSPPAAVRSAGRVEGTAEVNFLAGLEAGAQRRRFRETPPPSPRHIVSAGTQRHRRGVHTLLFPHSSSPTQTSRDLLKCKRGPVTTFPKTPENTQFLRTKIPVLNKVGTS